MSDFKSLAVHGTFHMKHCIDIVTFSKDHHGASRQGDNLFLVWTPIPKRLPELPTTLIVRGSGRCYATGYGTMAELQQECIQYQEELKKYEFGVMQMEDDCPCDDTCYLLQMRAKTIVCGHCTNEYYENSKYFDAEQVPEGHEQCFTVFNAHMYYCSAICCGW